MKRGIKIYFSTRENYIVYQKLQEQIKTNIRETSENAELFAINCPRLVTVIQYIIHMGHDDCVRHLLIGMLKGNN